MDSKYTTITIPKELSYRLRKLALEKGMKTSKMLELLIDQMEFKKKEKIKDTKKAMNNKIIIAKELDELLDLSKQLDNAYMHNKLDSIKKLLIQEWNDSDLFMENILKEINYEGKM